MVSHKHIRLSIFVFVVGLVGCTQRMPAHVETSSADETQQAGIPPVQTVEAAKPPASVGKKAKRLSEEDQKLADAQGICPVCGKSLDSAARPIKLTIGTRVVFADAQECWGPLMIDPKTYFDKLDALRDSEVANDGGNDSRQEENGTK